MKKYLKVILIPVIFFLAFPLLYSLINLFSIEISSIFYLGSVIIMTLITGILLGLITEKKAYLKGLTLGASMSLIMFLISLILKSKFTLYTLVYYLIIMISAIMGSIIGITKKDKK